MKEAESAALSIEELSVWFGARLALDRVSLTLPERSVTALIGPSGCGKSTLLRALNRTNDALEGTRTEGRVLLRGKDLYESGESLQSVRRSVGMVFQRPQPFPLSIFENVAFGLRVSGVRARAELVQRAEAALRKAALWEEVRTRLEEPALSLSGGQQQRLCIARALAVSPSVMLMDEPTAQLDPGATARIEDLLSELRKELCILVVTHSMQQAARISQRTVFLNEGRVVEAGETRVVFTRPKERLTEDYITGKFG